MRALILAISLIVLSAPPSSASDLHPQAKISYEKTPGFSETQTLPLLEWSARSQKNSEENLEQPIVPASLSASQGLRVRWLGVSGFEISDDENTILLDPFATRPNEVNALLFVKLRTNTYVVDDWILKGLDLDKVSVILNSNTHHEQVMDIPYILSKYQKKNSRPLLVGTPNLRNLLNTYTGQEAQFPWLSDADPLNQTPMMILETTPHENPKKGMFVGRFGKFKITAFPSKHSIYNWNPLGRNGTINGDAPISAKGYKTENHTTLNFLIEYDGFKMYFADSPNGQYFEELREEVGKVDILFQGIGARFGNNKIADYMGALRPRYVVPTHYDDPFKDLPSMTEFDYQIKLPLDFSRLEKFLQNFEPKYYKKARKKAWNYGYFYTDVDLRLMKMFYYYSLNNLVAASE